MLETGRCNQLEIIGIQGNALLLDTGESTPLPLPIEQVDRACQVGDTLTVFVYTDTAGQPVATTRRPRAETGQVAWLEIVEVNQFGAFADWGLPKDLFIPFAEQQHALRKGAHALVRVYLDNQNRLAGSTRIDHWIKDDATGLRVAEEVSLVIAERTELGYKAIINHSCWGLLYSNELFRPLRMGQVTTGYVKQIREDNRVDLSLEKPGFSKTRIDTVGERIIAELEGRGGQLPLTDKSPPEQIYATFGVSKKIFKQALGALYKQRRISLQADGIRLAAKESR